MAQQRMTHQVANLFRFLLMFEIDRFQLFDENEERILAMIGYGDDGTDYYDPDDEVQQISWDIQQFENMEDMLLISDFVRDHNLLDINQIVVTPGELAALLHESLHWTPARIQAGLDTLMKMRVDGLVQGQFKTRFFVTF